MRGKGFIGVYELNVTSPQLQILLNDRKIALDEVDAEKITLAPSAPENSKKCSC